jgi:hypothetical protein
LAKIDNPLARVASVCPSEKAQYASTNTIISEEKPA